MSQKVMVDGKEQELFTQEELDAKAKEVGEAATKSGEEASTKASEAAVEKYKEENPDKTAELTKAQEDLKAAEDKLAAAEGTEGNEGEDGDSEQVKRLRQERVDAQKKSDEEMEKVQQQLTVITDTLVGNVKKELLDKAARDDTDLREKIELKYDSFSGDAVTKDQITERMKEAVTLATGVSPQPGTLDSISNSSEKGNDGIGESEQHVPTENEKAIGKVLGVTEEDRKKYGPGGDKAAPPSVTGD